MEEWKDIKGYEGLYQISDGGRVKSLKRRVPYKWTTKSWKEKILSKTKNKDGYNSVRLTKCGIGKNFRVGRLVACAFHENPNNKRQVNHIDGKKEHDFVDNLEWATSSENLKHAYKTGLKQHYCEDHPLHKLTNDQVLEIRETWEKGNGGEFAERYNVSASTIYSIISRRRWATL